MKTQEQLMNLSKESLVKLIMDDSELHAKLEMLDKVITIKHLEELVKITETVNKLFK